MGEDRVPSASWLKGRCLTVDSLSWCRPVQMGEAGSYPELVLYRVNQAWAGAGILTEPD